MPACEVCFTSAELVEETSSKSLGVQVRWNPITTRDTYCSSAMITCERRYYYDLYEGKDYTSGTTELSEDTDLKTKLCVINLATRLNEFGHAHAEHIGWRLLALVHLELILKWSNEKPGVEVSRCIRSGE